MDTSPSNILLNLVTNLSFLEDLSSVPEEQEVWVSFHGRKSPVKGAAFPQPCTQLGSCITGGSNKYCASIDAILIACQFCF